MDRVTLIRGVLLLAIVILMIGCSSQDQRLADYAQQATQQQARQNETTARQSEQVAQQSQELASAAHRLVEQDAAARRELLEAQQRLQDQHLQQQAGFDQQRQELHAVQQAADQAAVREPVIAEALELHTDEYHAQTFQQLVDTCRKTLESLERKQGGTARVSHIVTI